MIFDLSNYPIGKHIISSFITATIVLFSVSIVRIVVLYYKSRNIKNDYLHEIENELYDLDEENHHLEYIINEDNSALLNSILSAYSKKILNSTDDIVVLFCGMRGIRSLSDSGMKSLIVDLNFVFLELASDKCSKMEEKDVKFLASLVKESIETCNAKIAFDDLPDAERTIFREIGGSALKKDTDSILSNAKELARIFKKNKEYQDYLEKQIEVQTKISKWGVRLTILFGLVTLFQFFVWIFGSNHDMAAWIGSLAKWLS